jgi:hypothetical protein
VNRRFFFFFFFFFFFLLLLYAGPSPSAQRFLVIGALLFVLAIVFAIVAATTPKGALIKHAQRRPDIPAVFTAKYVIDDLDEGDDSEPSFEFRGTVQKDGGDDPNENMHWHYYDKETVTMPSGAKSTYEIEYQLVDGQLYERAAPSADDPNASKDWTCAQLGTPVPRSVSGALSSMTAAEGDAVPSGRFACAAGATAWRLNVAGVMYALCASEDGTPLTITDEAHFVMHITKWSPGEKKLDEFVVPEGTPACADPDPPSGFQLPDVFTFDYSVRGVDDEDDVERFSYLGRGQKSAGDDIASFRFHYNETEVIRESAGGPPAGTHIIEYQYLDEDLYQHDPATGAWTCAPLGVPLPKSVATALQSVSSAAASADHPCPEGGKAWTINIAQVLYNFCTDAAGSPSSLWTSNFVMTISNFIPRADLAPFVPPPETPKDCPDS